MDLKYVMEASLLAYGWREVACFVEARPILSLVSIMRQRAVAAMKICKFGSLGSTALWCSIGLGRFCLLA